MNTNTKKTVLGLVLAAAFVAALSGCNTVRGAGEDLTKAADSTEKAISSDKK